MADLYRRKLRPNKMHIIAALLLIIFLVLFHSGLVRSGRVSARLNQAGFVFEDDGVRENRGVFFSARPYTGKLKGSDQQQPIIVADVQKGLSKNIEIFIGSVHRKYQFIAVEKDSKEYRKLLAGEKVTGYFSYEYTDELLDFVSRMGEYYEEEDVIPVEKVTKLGVVVVDRNKERRSLLYCLPFLLAGIILMKKAGEPFLYIPIENNE
jgi:hypothetical protein